MGITRISLTISLLIVLAISISYNNVSAVSGMLLLTKDASFYVLVIILTNKVEFFFLFEGKNATCLPFFSWACVIF